MKPELLLIRGLPGVGKTDVARLYSATHAHVEADLFFANERGHIHVKKADLATAHVWCQDWAAFLLQRRCNVVVANTFSRQWEIGVYVTLAVECDATLRVVELPEVRTHPLLPHLVYFAGRMRNRWESSPVPVEMVARPSADVLIPELPYQCQPGLCPLGPPFLETGSEPV